jgi:hypothetical protein
VKTNNLHTMVKIEANALAEKPVKRALYESFGKYIINTSDLHKRIVNIKYRNNVGIPSLPKKTNVDEEVIALLFNLIDTGNLNQELMDGLGREDYDYLANLLFKSGLRRMIKTNRNGAPSSQTQKRREFWLQRYRVLHGELAAGNDSPELFAELKETVIPGLFDSGAIDEERYHQLMIKVNEIINSA